MSVSSLQPPQPFEPSESPAEAWSRWKTRFLIYSTAINLQSKPVPQQRAILLHVLGETSLTLYLTFNIEETEAHPTVNEILQAFDEHYRPYRNTTYKRFVFFTTEQATGQSIDDYVTELRTKAVDCDFDALSDSLIRDRIIIGIGNPELQKRLLQEPELTLSKTIDICRANERSHTQVLTMHKEHTTLHALQTSKPTKTNHSYQKAKFSANNKPFKQYSANYQKDMQKKVGHGNCSRCGFRHEPRKCPAHGKTCNNCGIVNHFATVCRKKHLYAMTEDQEYAADLVLDTLTVHTLQNSNHPSDLQSILILNGNKVKVKLDTGAQANVLTTEVLQNWVGSLTIQPTTTRMMTYTGEQIPILGNCQVKCERNSLSYDLNFLIVDVQAPPILGLSACMTLGLLKQDLIDEQTSTCLTVAQLTTSSKAADILKDFDDVFSGLGELPGNHKIVLKPGAIPIVQTPRRIPEALRPLVEQELQRMVDLGIIEKVTEPTDWVHPMVVVTKPNGKIRICLDPRELNKWIKREHYQLPSPDDIIAQIPSAAYYTVLDASTAFWQVTLDEESSLLLTMCTPFGRLKFKRLPYGI